MPQKYIPFPYKSVVLIQADFELAWAWRYSRTYKNPLKFAKEMGLRERENIPLILTFCEQYEIPITWATVGHLFLRSCKRNERNLAHPDLSRLQNFKNAYWDFNTYDWYDSDPCTNFKDDPAWYGPDLIKDILNSNINHEIGCHTFSHIDCSDNICSPEIFNSEIRKCKELAEELNITLKSFVHPAHTIGNLNQLATYGFTSFRTDIENTLGFPTRHQSGIWEIKNTAPLYHRNEWSLNYHIFRYKQIIDRAIKSNTVCCLWFHPSENPTFLNHILPPLFEHIQNRGDDILVSNTGEYIDWLDRKASEQL